MFVRPSGKRAKQIMYFNYPEAGSASSFFNFGKIGAGKYNYTFWACWASNTYFLNFVLAGSAGSAQEVSSLRFGQDRRR